MNKKYSNTKLYPSYYSCIVCKVHAAVIKRKYKKDYLRKIKKKGLRKRKKEEFFSSVFRKHY